MSAHASTSRPSSACSPCASACSPLSRPRWCLADSGTRHRRHAPATRPFPCRKTRAHHPPQTVQLSRPLLPTLYSHNCHPTRPRSVRALVQHHAVRLAAHRARQPPRRGRASAAAGHVPLPRQHRRVRLHLLLRRRHEKVIRKALPAEVQQLTASARVSTRAHGGCERVSTPPTPLFSHRHLTRFQNTVGDEVGHWSGSDVALSSRSISIVCSSFSNTHGLQRVCVCACARTGARSSTSRPAAHLKNSQNSAVPGPVVPFQFSR